MSDTALNSIIQYGTQAERVAFTPDPAVGSQVLYFWYETDNAPDLYVWNGSAWVQVNDFISGINQLTGHVTAGPGSGSQTATINAANRTRVVTVDINGGGAVITTGVKGYIQLPVAVTLTGWTILSQDGISGSIQIDVWADTYANFPPTDADSITDGNEPAVSGTTKETDSDLSDWLDVTMPAGTILGFNVDSVTDLEHVTFQLYMTVD